MNIINIFSYIILFYFITLNLTYFLFFIISYFGIKSYNKEARLNDFLKIYQSKLIPPISLLVPAYNEEETIIANINSFLGYFNYPEYEVIIINDGSKDSTLKKIIYEYKCELYNFPYKKTIETKDIKNIYRSSVDKRLKIVDKYNGGKADALNAGINVSKYPYFGSIDADTILEPDSYLKVILPIIDNPNNVIATGGIVGVINGCEINENKVTNITYPKNILAAFQVVEYLRAFLFGRYAWTLLNALPIISGAFGLFQKKAVMKIGGYSTSSTKKTTVGEDIDLIIRLHKYHLENKLKYKIMFVPDPLSWTQVPEDFKTLRNQRARWHKGLIETLSENRELIFNRKYKLIGMLALPYYLIFELFSPIIEIMGYIVFPIFYFAGRIDLKVFVLFYIFSTLLGVLISLSAVLLEVMTFNRYKRIRDIFKLFIFAILENFGYRQITLVFRLLGFVQFAKKDSKWGEMKRKKL